MGMVVVSSPPPSPSLIALSSPSRQPLFWPLGLRQPRLPPRIAVSRLSNITSKCSVTNIDVDFDSITTEDEVPQDNPFPAGCSIPIVRLTPDIFDSDFLNILKGDGYTCSLLTKLPVLSEEEQFALAATPAHPAGTVKVGPQILQTGIPVNKANLLGTTEISIASLAEFVMLGVAIISNDVSHFGFLAIPSVSSVVGAAWIFCHWLPNPTDEQRKLFSFDPQF